MAQVENNIVVAKAEAVSKFYVVQSGDTLWKIAETQYGHGKGAKHQEIF
ncbi:LysM peptidoglycan-binding domain-containing protein [Methylocystis sp.]|nr:LysM peptidoglycan-binding domain-containing protein [Methylocystis sp.]